MTKCNIVCEVSNKISYQLDEYFVYYCHLMPALWIYVTVCTFRQESRLGFFTIESWVRSSKWYPDWLATGRASGHQKLAPITPFKGGQRLTQVNLQRGRKMVYVCVCVCACVRSCVGYFTWWRQRTAGDSREHSTAPGRLPVFGRRAPGTVSGWWRVRVYCEPQRWSADWRAGLVARILRFWCGLSKPVRNAAGDAADLRRGRDVHPSHVTEL